jgi:membrane protein
MFHGLESHLRLERPWGRLWKLLRLAGVNTYSDNCLALAKAVAYSGLLSFFPVLTTVAALLVDARADAVSHAIASFLYEVVPPGTEDIVRDLFIVHGQRPRSVLVAAVLLSVWAASGAMISLMEGFQAIYHLPSGRSFLKERGVAVLLVIVSAIPLWGASVLIVFGERILGATLYWLGLFPSGADLKGPVVLLAQLLRYGVAFAGVVLVTALIYYLGPNRKQSFAGVFPGAAAATALWMLATVVFAWYVRHVGNYNLLYGSVGAGLALLVWMYLLGVIMLFGCEVNAARESSASEPAA